MICSDVVISEIRNQGESVYNLEIASLINYIRLLMLSMCLIPLVAVSNGFKFVFEENIFRNLTGWINTTGIFEEHPDNYTVDSYVLSLALEE